MSWTRVSLFVACVILARTAEQPMFRGSTERPLRYHPEGQDFVIENGAEFFNRPLYGYNTAFRVDAGDKPEFTLYLPGRGGNLRLGFQAGGHAKWLFDAARIVTRYRPGAMLYEITDPLLGGGVIRVKLLAMSETEGLIAGVELAQAASPVELFWAYGGVNGERGARDGDIGTEKEPVTRFFQMRPEFCRDNRFSIQDNRAVLQSKAAQIAGLFPAGSKLAVADANRWQSWPDLEASAGHNPELPVLIGHVSLPPGPTIYLALQRISQATVPLPPSYTIEQLPQIFAATDRHFRAIAERLAVDTPDPFINAAAGALAIAADGVWDGPTGTVVHGAVAWRTSLLGWRGPYAMDDLGWHDRMRHHLDHWAAKQNTSSFMPTTGGPDPGMNLTRMENILHSNGDMSNNHYDMNMVYIDELMRHLLWTGDVAYARKMWPTIERHKVAPSGTVLYAANRGRIEGDDLAHNTRNVRFEDL